MCFLVRLGLVCVLGRQIRLSSRVVPVRILVGLGDFGSVCVHIYAQGRVTDIVPRKRENKEEI